MQDRVGNSVPSQQQVQTWVSQIKEVMDQMAPYGVRLTPEDRRHALRFRPGGDRIARLMADTATRHNVALPGVSAQGLISDLQLAEVLEPLRTVAEDLHGLVDDTVLEARSECWWATTALYSALSRLVDAFPDIKAAIGQASDFFATRRRPTAAAPATPTTK